MSTEKYFPNWDYGYCNNNLPWYCQKECVYRVRVYAKIIDEVEILLLAPPRVSESDRSEKKYSTNNFKKYSNMQRELKTAKCISMDAFRYRFHIHNNLNYLLEHYLQLHSMVGILPQSLILEILYCTFFSICCDIELQELMRDRFWSRLKVASSEVRKRPSVVLRWLADSLAMQLSSPTPMYDVLQLTSISELTPLCLYAWGIPLIAMSRHYSLLHCDWCILIG